MTAMRCPHCNGTIMAPANLAGQQWMCPACHEPFTVPAWTVDPETDPVGPADVIPDEPKEPQERPRPRRPLTRTSTFPWILASVFGLLIVALGVVVAILINRQSVADKLFDGVEDKPQPAPAPRPPTAPAVPGPEPVQEPAAGTERPRQE